MKKIIKSLFFLVISGVLINCSNINSDVNSGNYYLYKSQRIQIAVENKSGFMISIQGDAKRKSIIKDEIYLKFEPESTPVNLSDLTKKSIAEKYGNPIRATIFYKYENGAEKFTDGNAEFVFSREKLVWFSLSKLSSKGKVGPWIGTNSEGPFYRIPFSEKEMQRLFGDPELKVPYERL